jgi:hypothetical protein
MRTVSSAEMLPTCWCIRPSLFPGSADVPHTPCHPSFKADQCIDSTTGLRSISLTNPLAGWRLWISACHPLPDPILEDFLTTCTSPVQLMPSISSSSVCSRKPHAGAQTCGHCGGRRYGICQSKVPERIATFGQTKRGPTVTLANTRLT